MKEALVILLVIFLLLALTAVRYRKQIAGLLGVARMLRDAKRAASGTRQSFPQDREKAGQLVNCAKCGVWVPEGKARKLGEVFFCSNACLQGSKVNV
jgi:hypothetical protein